MMPWSTGERSERERANVPGTTAVATRSPTPTPVSVPAGRGCPRSVIGSPRSRALAARLVARRRSGAEDLVLLLLELGACEHARVPEGRQVLELGQLGVH